jgi:hypothetical protein
MPEQERRNYHCDEINMDIVVVANIPYCRYFNKEKPASCMFRNCDSSYCPAQTLTKIIGASLLDRHTQSQRKCTERRPTLTRTQESLDEEARWAEAREAEQEPFPLFSG